MSLDSPVQKTFKAGDFDIDVLDTGDVMMWDRDNGDAVVIPREALTTVFTQLCAAHVYIGRLPR